MLIQPVKLYGSLPAGTADLYLLILSSQGIECRFEKYGNRFELFVEESKMIAARAMINAYHSENRISRIKQQIQQLPVSTFKSVSCCIVMAVMALIHFGSVYLQVHEDMILSYGASSLYILQGQTYRTVSALFLHADVQHLLGNMAGLFFFAGPVISLSGYGSGLFILLFAGSTGNLLNAFFHQTAHLSIGASTVVMAAAGLLAGFQFTSKANIRKFNSLVPIFAGAVLVALFSHGERTDVWAHVFGFAAGLVSGLFFFPLDRTLPFKYKNAIALALTMAILCAAFLAPFGTSR